MKTNKVLVERDEHPVLASDQVSRPDQAAGSTGWNRCSRVISIRLSHNEVAILNKLRQNYNPTEYIRYLIISEEQRRHGEGRARPAQYMSDMRNGRTRNEHPGMEPRPLYKQL